MNEEPALRPLKSQFPYADTLASITLKAALKSSKRNSGKSLRAVARELNYKQPVVLSHMAHGRIPIPIERAEEIADALGMDPKLFVKLVLTQRYPDLDLASLSDNTFRAELSHGVTYDTLKSVQVPDLSEGQKRVMREVMRDISAPERWLTPHEVEVMALIRRLRPTVGKSGLDAADLTSIKLALQISR